MPSYYIMNHMVDCMWKHTTFTRKDDITNWGKNLAIVAPDDIRVEFRRMQSTLATFIHNDVANKKGISYNAQEPHEK